VTTTDIVERLRRHCNARPGDLSIARVELFAAAADEIERLRSLLRAVESTP